MIAGGISQILFDHLLESSRGQTAFCRETGIIEIEIRTLSGALCTILKLSSYENIKAI